MLWNVTWYVLLVRPAVPAPDPEHPSFHEEGRVLERNDPLLEDARITRLLESLPFGELTLHDDCVEFSDPSLSNLSVALGGSVGEQLATAEGRMALLASLHERIAELLARVALRCA